MVYETHPKNFREYETVELDEQTLRNIHAEAAKYAFEQNKITLKQARPIIAAAKQLGFSDGLETKLD